MRAPFQILAIPFRRGERTTYCVFRRSDCDQWQFIAGGGEGSETPREAALREIAEEGGIRVEPEKLIELRSVCSITTDCFPRRKDYGWADDLFVIPEYSFAFECPGEIRLSGEHTECRWVSYDEAREMLKWDSNRTALYEVDMRIKTGR